METQMKTKRREYIMAVIEELEDILEHEEKLSEEIFCYRLGHASNILSRIPIGES